MANDNDGITPDPPPAEPFEVQVSPDPGPADPIPVDVFPDPPPSSPMPVDVFADPGPWSPVAVGINPAPGPASPSPVSVTPDPGPWSPTAPGVTPDPGPIDPTPVQVQPDPPPTPVVAPGIAPDAPPGAPIPVAVSPAPPPLDIDFRSIPSLPPPYVPHDIRDANDLVSSYLMFEQEVSKWLLGGIGISGDFTEKNGGDPGSRALDPTFLVDWYRSYLKASQITSFIAEQGILYAMNDTVGRIFNPGYFVAMSIPGAMGHFIPSDAAIRNMGDVALERDEVLKAKARDNLDPAENAFGPIHRADESLDFTVDDMIDAAIDGTGQGTYMSILPGSSNGEGQPPVLRFDASKYFDTDSNTGLLSKVKPGVKIIANNLPPRSPLLQAEQGPNGVGIIRVGAPGEAPDGAVYNGLSQDPSNGPAGVDDDAVRMPLVFTDLRKDPITNAWRSVYFPAFNVNFSMGFSPEYDEKPAFGRTDPVVNYIRTTRTVSLSWEVMAFVPEDLLRMYNKMMWLTSMVYPSYTPDGLMQSGPVMSLRIGDVVGSVDGGLPGVIRNLNFDFADALWELKKGMKVPRSFQVSTELLVLHSGPVGILNGAFGVLSLPSIGGNQSQVNYAPRDNGAPTAAAVSPGAFARFGEPVRKG